MTDFAKIHQPEQANAALVLEDGSVLWGMGFGAATQAVGEVCFNTSMSGYQEILTDPSYAGQIINFTFPHIGNVGTNKEDMEAKAPAALGCITREYPTAPSNWRKEENFGAWLEAFNLPGICQIDTRALTRYIRDKGAPSGCLVYQPEGKIDIAACHEQIMNWPGLKGMDLARAVSCRESYHWKQKCWDLREGYTDLEEPRFKVVAIDYGAKYNILRCLAQAGCDVTVVPATAKVDEILSHEPDGIFLSNGPGDPQATAEYAVPVIKTLLEKDLPVFGICLGHQLLALALGAKTEKMHMGHRGANQPVQDFTTGKVEITSQNHGFEVIHKTLPEGNEATHISLFDKSNEGLRIKDKPVFSVQYHPEASPGPQDSYYLFERFVDNIKQSNAA